MSSRGVRAGGRPVVRVRPVAAALALAVSILAAGAGDPAGPRAAPAAARADRAAILDVAHDVLLERAFVPSPERPQGEVRVVRRGGHAVVQTLLYTRVLKRVLGVISDKERKNWPEGGPGHADMERYVAGLEEFRRAVASWPDQPGAEVDRRVRALIEFVDVPGAPLVAIGGVDIEGSGESIRVRGRAAPAILDLSPDYVRRNMRLIVADAFHVSEDEAATRLAKAAAP